MNITTEQAWQRLKVIPSYFKDVLFSSDTASFIGDACKNKNLSQEKVDSVAIITGWVILGFVRVKDMAQELQSATSLDINICKDIAAYLENKIFNSIRADLDKIYAPPETEPARMEEIKSGTTPKPGSGIEAPAATTTQAGVSVPVPPEAVKFIRPSFIKDTKGVPLPSPKPLSDLMKPKTVLPMASPAPAPPAVSGNIPAVPAPSISTTPTYKPTVTGPAAPVSGLGSTFSGKTISPAPTNLPSQAALRPAMSAAPKLDVKFGTASGGQISKPGGGLPGVGGAVKIEVGQIKQAPPNLNLNTPAPAKEQVAQKIVHYSQWSTPVAQVANNTPSQAGPVPLQHIISGQGIASARSNTGPKLPPPPPPPLRK